MKRTPIAVWLAGPAAASFFDVQMLSDEERERYATFRSQQRRTEFAVSRALRAGAVPDLAMPSSLSHSGGWAAVACAPAGLRIGVDIEWFRPHNVLKLARFAYHPQEVAMLESVPESECRRTFYALWTLKESMAKALGVPLLTATRQCVFLKHDDEWQGRAPLDEPWSALSFRPRPDMALAVVVIGEPSLASMATIEWPPRQHATWPTVARVRAVSIGR